MTTGAETTEDELVERGMTIVSLLLDNKELQRARLRWMADAAQAMQRAEDAEADNARLRAILATLPEPVYVNTSWDTVCLACHQRQLIPLSPGMSLEHAPDCPWLVVVNARGEAHR
jgi:hypothetical protein